jgi:hypothetical protein
VLFNVFLNDILNFVKENKLYNYADDNTLSYSGPDLNGLIVAPMCFTSFSHRISFPSKLNFISPFSDLFPMAMA